MAKRKAGLHKEIASIFDGAPLPRRTTGAEQSPQETARRHAGLSVPQTPAQGLKIPPITQGVRQPSSLIPKATVPKAKKNKVEAIRKPALQVLLQEFWKRIKTKIAAKSAEGTTTRQKVMKMLIPILAVIVVLLYIRAFHLTLPKTKELSVAGQVSTTVSSGSQIDWEIPPPYPTTIRNPMKFGRVTVGAAGIGDLIVTGILHSEDNPAAVIGNQIVHEGEEILGATIIKINKESVEFEMDGKRWGQKVQR